MAPKGSLLPRFHQSDGYQGWDPHHRLRLEVKDQLEVNSMTNHGHGSFLPLEMPQGIQ